MKNPLQKMSRRQFLQASAALGTQLALLSVPAWMREAVAQESSQKKSSLVVVLLRGAADGLNMVVPYTEDFYRRARPTLGLNAPGKSGGVLDLDGQFGLNPAMGDLLPLYKAGQMAFVHAAGSPHPTRSHFDAQDFMESGTPGLKSTDTGWLNRALLSDSQKKMNPLAAVALTSSLPPILRGDFKIANMLSADKHKFLDNNGTEKAFKAMYEETLDKNLSGAGSQAADSVEKVQALLKNDKRDLLAAGYHGSNLAGNFFDMARILKADVGTRAGFLDYGGWDHHVNENNAYSGLPPMVKNLSRCLAAFYRDLGDQANEVTTVVMSEFGRTVRENGNGGTDHGHGGLMMVLGGQVKGGKVYGKWPGLDPEVQWEGQDLQVTTDFRQVCSEALVAGLGVRDISQVFPGYKAGKKLGII